MEDLKVRQMSLQLVNYIISKDAVGSMRNPALVWLFSQKWVFYKILQCIIAESIVLY